MQAMSVICSGV